MLALYDVVKLKNPEPSLGLTVENIGFVIDILNNGKAYVIEFIDSDGNTIEDSLFVDFTEDQLIKQ